jgi:cyclophilin family peptidyl-prolyl cis-trans isomerase
VNVDAAGDIVVVHAVPPAPDRRMSRPLLRSRRAVVGVVGVVVSVVSVVATSCATTPPPPDPAQQIANVAALETARAPASAFAAALRAPDAALRRRAMLALARLERLDAVDVTLAALADVDASVRATAAFSAGQLDLALDPERSAHEAVRARVETALVTRLGVERDASTRLALVRALGRVAAGDGLQRLVQRAQDASSTTTAATKERGEAFTALGVSGARRKASLSRDDGLRAAVMAGLVDADDLVGEGAAYAAFRQKLAVEPAIVVDALGRRGAQARVFLARTATVLDATAAREVMPRLLADDDWRVRVEAVRALGQRHDPLVDQLPAVLTAAVARRAAPGDLHVIRETCLALADVGTPATALPVLSAAVAQLGVGDHAARCACASAIEVLGGADDAVAQCVAPLEVEQQHKHALETIAHARISSSEKVAALLPALAHENVRVRSAAAAALCAEPTVAAADVAARQLLSETDAGVASGLLECFANDANAEMLRDRTIATAVSHFVDAQNEALEPLVALADLARLRPGLREIASSLATHSDARVRDAASHTAAGDRAPGPRAKGAAPPAPTTLPTRATITTTRGAIELVFERELAPVAVSTFTTLAKQGAYNGTLFHRVIADFVAQGGDPRGDGAGGPGFAIPCENSDARFERGTVGIATAGKDTGGSQFFLVHSSQPHLDGRYTLFARVTRGLDVVDALQKDDVVTSITVVSTP